MGTTHKKALLAVVAAAVLAAFIVGCGRGTVAKVNGRKISRQEYYKRLERLQYRDSRTMRQMESGAWVLERLITEELLLRLAEEEKVPPTEEQVRERLANAKKQPGFAANLKAAGITKDEVKYLMRVEQAAVNLQTKGVKVSDKEIKEYYDANKDTQFTEPEHANVAAIFVDSQADADKAMELLDKGVEFDTVARTLSTGPELGTRGGDLGATIVRGDPRVSESVQDLVLSTPKNKYTEPIPRGENGYIIFKVLKHVPEKTKKFQDVEFSIREYLMREKGTEKKHISLQEELVKFREDAKIEVYIERYKKALLPATPDEDKKEADGEKKDEDKTNSEE